MNGPSALSKSVLVVCVAGLLAAFALTSLAVGRVIVHHHSRVTIAPGAPAFHGKVISPEHACEIDRKVVMFRKMPGPDENLGSDHTGNRGRWKVIVDPLSSGAYYAKVKRRAEGTAGTIHVCDRDTSRVVVVD